jgi:hypothetical protein
MVGTFVGVFHVFVFGLGPSGMLVTTFEEHAARSVSEAIMVICDIFILYRVL